MTDTNRTVPLLLLGLLAAPLGCSSGANVNIGDTESLGGKLSDYAAEWDGYAEAYTFQPSSSDHIHITLDAQGHGTLRVGTDALLPPPTDPNVGYPAGATADGYKIGFPTNLSGGVLYPVHAAQVESNRIQFGLLPSEFYAAWCALQTPYYVLAGYMGGGGGAAGNGVPLYTYSCVPGAGGGSSGVPPNVQCTVQNSSVDGGYSDQPIDCGKFGLCISGVCTCTATSCTSSTAMTAADTIPAGYPAELDGALDSSGKALTGTLNLNGTRVTVHLTRK